MLDPACGSGNFLFLGLKALKDVEHRSHLEAAALGLDREADLVTGPHNVLGIELNEYAAELARVSIWIGEIQWRIAHGYPPKTNPVLEPLDQIECRDALLANWGADSDFTKGNSDSDPQFAVSVGGSQAQAGRTPGAHTLRFLKSPPTSAPPAPLSGGAVVKTDGGAVMKTDGGAVMEATGGVAMDAAGRATTEEETGSDHDFAQRNSGSDPVSCGVREANWPRADVVIGNPPFVGDRKMIRELGEDYTFTLRRIYEGRVPGGADLVCYWFEKARTAIETNGLGAAGLVATNSIRGGANRKVLDAISTTSRIFEAWADEPWVNEGAAVRVSLVCFGHAAQPARLDGRDVPSISADLSETHGIADVHKLSANRDTSFIGTQKNGPFDVPREVAAQWLALPNPHHKSNALVVRPWANGLDVTRRPQQRWVVDFGCDMPLQDAALFEGPFAYVEQHVKPTRANVRRDFHRTHWWLYGDARPGLRKELSKIDRFIVTPMVAKHRVFAWMPAVQIPENLCVAITRADDTTFGILHSRFHELWSLRMGTSLEDRPRYTPTTCFETFPFPAGLTPLDTAHQRLESIEGGAVIPADLPAEPPEARMGRMSGATLKSPKDAERPASAPSSPAVKTEPAAETGHLAQTRPAAHTQLDISPRQAAEQIAKAAQRLNDLREAWLNPPEWTERIPEVVPLGMSASPYPDRIVPRPGHEKDLAARTLTKLYNQRPAWLATAHQTLDAAVAAAYGWTDYRADMPDEEILKRLLALNLARSD